MHCRASLEARGWYTARTIDAIVKDTSQDQHRGALCRSLELQTTTKTGRLRAERLSKVEVLLPVLTAAWASDQRRIICQSRITPTDICGDFSETYIRAVITHSYARKTFTVSGSRSPTLRDSGAKFVAADMPDANDLTVGITALVAQQELLTLYGPG